MAFNRHELGLKTIYSILSMPSGLTSGTAWYLSLWQKIYSTVHCCSGVETHVFISAAG